MSDYKHNNNGKGIKGYRDLSEREISLMNECKELASQVGKMCEKLSSEPSTDLRWVKEGQMEAQKAFMCLVRSIAKPESF